MKRPDKLFHLESNGIRNKNKWKQNKIKISKGSFLYILDLIKRHIIRVKESTL